MELRPYQVKTVDWQLEHPRSILGSAPGLGKTVCALRTFNEHGPTLVVCALRDAMWTWEKELEKWLPGANFSLYYGTPEQRAKIDWSKSDYVITTPRMLDEILPHRKKWAAWTCDEAHLVKGRDTDVMKLMRKILSERFIWMSGSPIVNTPADLWVALNLIDKKQFSSYWRWVFEHCEVENDGWGNKIKGVKDPEHTRTLLEPYYWGIPKSEVQDQLPPKNRYPIYAQPTDEQTRLYREVEEDMIGHLANGELLLSPNVLSVGTRLQQILISPELLPGWTGHAKSGTLDLLHSKIEEDFANDQDVAVFTPYTKAIPIIARHLPACETFVISGGRSTNRQTIRDFQSETRRKALICTIRSAASFDAYSASVGYFVGRDWTPAYNLQAEDRLHREGQTRSVDIRYIVNRGTWDDHQIEVLDDKNRWTEALLKRRRVS